MILSKFICYWRQEKLSNFSIQQTFVKKRDKKKNAGMQSLKLKFAVVEGFDKVNLSKICEKIFPWNSADVLAVFARVSEALIST